MVLEHQTEMHNFITLASYETRMSLHHDATMNPILERPKGFVSESTQRRISRVAEKLVRHMLFADEIPLTDKITGTSKFTQQFVGLGVKDKQGRSLRDFDLSRRIFKYPCSYLIYSDSFRALPSKVKSQVYQRIWNVLTEKNQAKEFAALSSKDRQAILAILRDTNSDLPAYWKQPRAVQR